ncbi:molecular chaperone [Lacrimispora amygdalina]|jgi:hypothetical protein|uniref:Molecular chaperone n=1 Tax=Lacrimispora amygdalina TaxID=253257 RepID=A0A3E2NG00_9FIRM|nr:molecular chaperone [Clostridium indicum]RFZ79820.1 molecular chaperone [Clostridium indicum]
MKLTKYEKETIVLTSEGDTTTSIFTYNADLKRRLEKFSKQYPTLCKLENSNSEGGVSYVLDKSRVSIRLVAPYSEERRRAASENAKKNGFTGLAK